MRKYYRPANVRKRASNRKLEQTLNPWFLLRTYVMGAAGYFHWDELCALLSCCERESVSAYLSIVSDLEDRLQLLTEFEDIAQVHVHRQVSALLKKYPFVENDLETDRRVTAIEKWKSAEDQCRATNERLKSLSRDELPKWVYRAQRVCAAVLEDLTPGLIMKIINQGMHGPGSTLSSRGNRVSAHYKFADLPYTVTKTARPYAYAAISSDRKWLDYLESTGRRKELPPFGSRVASELMLMNDCVELIEADKVTFVPKDCKTDRPIAVGASLNLFLQLGVKTYMQERLKHFGIDLDDQSKNQAYARIGSVPSKVNPDAQFSTIDLASASDTVSIEIVKLLLPPEWFAFLDDLRHKTGVLGDETIEYSKFSAMGNGFTFPLESLIFFSICKATIEEDGFPCTKNDIAVYGDDIIVRRKHSHSVISSLKWSGFSINESKSFLSGYFKESCGKDYYNGADVRPIYIKKEISTYEDIYKLANLCNAKSVNRDYATCYSQLYAVLVTSVTTIDRNFGPMVGTEKEESLSDSFFQVPLSFMNRQGLRPWLTIEEKGRLASEGMLREDDVDIQSMYYCVCQRVALRYKARESVNYMIRLRTFGAPVGNDRFSYSPVVYLGGIDSRSTNRRESYRYVTTVRPIPNWNGSVPRTALTRCLIDHIVD